MLRLRSVNPDRYRDIYGQYVLALLNAWCHDVGPHSKWRCERGNSEGQPEGYARVEVGGGLFRKCMSAVWLMAAG